MTVPTTISSKKRPLFFMNKTIKEENITIKIKAFMTLNSTPFFTVLIEITLNVKGGLGNCLTLII